MLANSIANPPGKPIGSDGPNGTAPLQNVFTTIATLIAFPVKVMELGTMLHVIFGERLVHPSVTVPVTPGNEVSVNPNTALLPGVVGTVEGLPGASPIVTGEVPLLNVAVTVTAALTVTVHVPVPGHPATPLQPANVDPSAGIAVRMTAVPLAKLAEHVVVGQLIPVGALVTVPAPVPASLTVSTGLFVVCVKFATTVTVVAGGVGVVIVNVHVPVPSQGPAPQPVNVDPVAAVAVNIIEVPLGKLNVHVAPQLIPVGTLFTVPVPLPAGVITRVTLVLAPIVAVALAVLLPGFGSGRSDVTLALFTTVPVAPAFTVTTIVTVAAPAFATVPKLHVTTVVPVQAAPCEPVADTSVAFVGNVSDTIVFVASLGPAFVTFSV
jgi:hypothetical protein